MNRIAAIQMCSSHLIEDNLKTAEQFIKEAASNKAKLIVLPENFAIVGLKPEDKVAVKETVGTGLIQDFLAEQAKSHGCWILGGTIPIAGNNGNKVRAASLLYNSQGELAVRYDKIHLFDVELSPAETYKESDTIEAGDKLVVVDTPIGKLGLGVCYDVRFPEMFRYLFNQGAEIFALPSAFTVPTGEAHWEVLTRSRAIENFCYLIGAGQGGTHTSGRKTYGNSLIVEPWGGIVGKASGTTPGVIYAEVDLGRLREIRASVPVAKHRRLGVDVGKAFLNLSKNSNGVNE